MDPAAFVVIAPSSTACRPPGMSKHDYLGTDASLAERHPAYRDQL